MISAFPARTLRTEGSHAGLSDNLEIRPSSSQLLYGNDSVEQRVAQLTDIVNKAG
jgi:hypothetical protein